jgi:hypothetical protein
MISSLLTSSNQQLVSDDSAVRLVDLGSGEYLNLRNEPRKASTWENWTLEPERLALKDLVFLSIDSQLIY